MVGLMHSFAPELSPHLPRCRRLGCAALPRRFLRLDLGEDVVRTSRRSEDQISDAVLSTKRSHIELRALCFGF